MIKINKPDVVPDKLKEIQSLIAEDLYNKKEKFAWRTEHYSDPIKNELKEIYYNKCAFCETKLTETDTDNKFTVEHYRPKEYYYWLGAEWTNLFPTCVKCNNNKASFFLLLSERNKIKQDKAPFDDNGKLIVELCKAENLLEEKPVFLHPELDKTEKYFCFKPSGKIILNEENLSNPIEKYRAKTMIDKFLNRPSLEEKRKLKINYYRDRLIIVLTKAIPLLKSNYTERDIKLLFLDFFSDLILQKEKNAEFSLLGYYMIVDFDKFFLNDIKNNFGEELKELVKYAYSLFISD